MKQLSTMLLFLLAALSVAGQNLVPNGDFESVNVCPFDSAHTYSKNWYNPNAGSADHFTFLTNSPGGCVPFIGAVGCINPNMNFQGYQLPHTGSGYGGFGTTGAYYDTTSGGEYLATRLSDSLIANKKYCVSYWVNMASTTRWALDAIGVVFKHDSIIGSNSELYCCTYPDVDSPIGIAITDTVNWILVQDTFLARGGEQYMVIGHLRHNNLTTYFPIDTVGQGDGRFAYYYVDDISVTYCDLPQDTPSIPEIPEITITPNPGNGTFVLQGTFPAETALRVFDVLGQIVYEQNISEGSHVMHLSLQLAEGTYIYQVRQANTVLKSGKLILAQ